MFRKTSLLFAADGSGGGAGGAGDDKSGGDTGQPFTPAQLEHLGKTINAAITGHMKRGLGSAVTDAFKAINWREIIEPVMGEILAEDDTDTGGSGGGEGDDASKSKRSGVDPDISRQLAKLADDLEKEKAARLAAVKESERVRQEHEFSSARQKLYESLKPHASESLHEVWVDNLIHHKRLKIEEGQPLLEVEYVPSPGMPKQREFLPLEEAVAKLATSEEAKRFMPVPDGSGGGGNPGPRNGARRANNAPKLDSKDPYERAQARLAALGIDADSEFSP